MNDTLYELSQEESVSLQSLQQRFEELEDLSSKARTLIILFDDPGARVPLPPIVLSGPMLNPDGRDVPSLIEKRYGGFPSVTSGLYVAVPPEIHCGSSLDFICRVLSVVGLVVRSLIIKIDANNNIRVFHLLNIIV